ncbi:MAG: hypothetical protein U0V48_14610 [Anaerolineales bacterium]
MFDSLHPREPMFQRVESFPLAPTPEIHRTMPKQPGFENIAPMLERITVG